MMKKMRCAKILLWGTAFLPLLAVALAYKTLPGQIPSHWNLNGEATYSGKGFLWLMALLPPLMAAGLVFLPKIDPRKDNYEEFEGFYYAFAVAIMLFFLGMILLILSESFYPGRLAPGNVVTAGIGVLFAFIGNIMPKFKSNFFIGIKTPWTLSSAEVWQKTHRAAGVLWFWGGILIFALSFFLKNAALFTVFITVTLAIALIPAAMSYVWYQKAQK